MTFTTPQRPRSLALYDQLRTLPVDVPDAIERIARIKALAGWLTGLETPVRTWLETKAAEVETMTGSAFRTAAAGIGTAHLTDPQPTPRIADPDAFGRWYVTEILGDDPDRDGTEMVVRFDRRVGRRLTATADPADLIAFLNEQVATPAGAAEVLANRIRVDVEWLISEATLDDMLAGSLHRTADGPRLKATEGRVIDTDTGEQVPGVHVTPAGKRALTVTPDKALKTRLADELIALIGPPILTDD